MKTLRWLLSGLLILASAPSEAAVKTHTQKNRLTIIRDGVHEYQYTTRQYAFRVEVISDNEGLKPENRRAGLPFIVAQPEERYSIRLHNPLPVRVAVNLTVDGLNSLTGQPSGIEDGAKWMIDPHATITIRGWQVNQGERRRFFFTEKPKTYAAWRGEKLNKNLSVNCGVIGAAFFWNKRELQDYFDSNPTYVTTRPWRCGMGEPLSAAEAAPQSLADRAGAEELESRSVKKEKAGTGMGERESHPTTYVDFHYDTGMFKPSQAVVLYYDFSPSSRPNPFPNLSFAPEMP